jgi:membrane protein YqaA with SNARE-associated domain
MSLRRFRIRSQSRACLAALLLVLSLAAPASVATAAVALGQPPPVTAEQPAGQPASGQAPQNPAQATPPAESGLSRWLPDLRGLAQPALYAITFAVAFIGGVIPFIINVEVYLVAVVALSDTSALAHVILMTLGQTLAKWILYEAGKGVLHLRWIRWARMDKAKAAFERHGNKTMGVVAASATIGFPPLYGVALVAGTMRLPLRPFMLLITAGRFLRFGLVGLGPWLVQRYW